MHVQINQSGSDHQAVHRTPLGPRWSLSGGFRPKCRNLFIHHQNVGDRIETVARVNDSSASEQKRFHHRQLTETPGQRKHRHRASMFRLFMGAFPYLRSNLEHRSFIMQTQTHKRLGVLRADSPGWNDLVRNHIEEGWNFVLVLPNKPEAVEDFCHLFGLPTDCKPKTLTRSGLFRLSQFMEPDVFDEALASWGPDSQIVFVEQLDFPINRP